MQDAFSPASQCSHESTILLETNRMVSNSDEIETLYLYLRFSRYFDVFLSQLMQ